MLCKKVVARRSSARLAGFYNGHRKLHRDCSCDRQEDEDGAVVRRRNSDIAAGIPVLYPVDDDDVTPKIEAIARTMQSKSSALLQKEKGGTDEPC
ncbi:hypothetical protein MRX96_040030 [Rhipicephalus microplus]